MDTEGTPIQELAAMEVNATSFEIMDVFHAYAQTTEADIFARKHIHGLNQDFVSLYGLPSESHLLLSFLEWLSKKSSVAVFANGPDKEQRALKLKIHDFKLTPWAVRQNNASHQIAIKYKELSIPLLNHSCPTIAHSSFVSPPPTSNSDTFLAKLKHGHHCAFYDIVELYFAWIMQ